jgi:hypothetical protein
MVEAAKYRATRKREPEDSGDEEGDADEAAQSKKT